MIKDNELDVGALKSNIERLTWTKYDRKLSENRIEHFLIGRYTDDEESIKITVRPSNVMSVVEVYYNYSLDGVKVDNNYKGKTCDWGASAEVRIDKSLRDKIESLCTEKIKKPNNIISWD